MNCAGEEKSFASYRNFSLVAQVSSQYLKVRVKGNKTLL
jgi:hypothetical protein